MENTFAIPNYFKDENERLVIYANQIYGKMRRGYGSLLIHEMLKNDNIFVMFVSKFFTLLYDVKLASDEPRIGIMVEVVTAATQDANTKIVNVCVGPSNNSGLVVDKAICEKLTPLPRLPTDDVGTIKTVTDRIEVCAFTLQFTLNVDMLPDDVMWGGGGGVTVLLLRSYDSFNAFQKWLVTDFSIVKLVIKNVDNIMLETELCQKTFHMMTLTDKEKKRANTILTDVLHDQWQLKCFIEDFKNKLLI